jgi:hypothetical protein
MKIQNSKFKVAHYSSGNSHANFTDMNNLYNRGLVSNDTTALGAIGVLASSMSLGAGKSPLMDLARGADTVMVDSDNYEWEFIINGYRPARILEDVEPANLFKGMGQQTFKIKLDVDWFVETDVLVPTDSKRYNVRIMSTPVRDGDGTIYEVKLSSMDETLFLPQEFVAPSTLWTKLASTVSEASQVGGSMHFDAYSKIKFRSFLTTFRKQYSITADAASQKVNGSNLTLADKVIVGGSNKDESSEAFQKRMSMAMKQKSDGWYWASMADIKFGNEFEMELERHMFYGRMSSNTEDPRTGYVIKMGPGFQELMEDGNQYYYNKLTLKLLTDFFRGLFFDRIKFGDRNIVMWTGEIGLTLFDEAIREVTQGMFKDMKDFFIEKTGESLAPGGPAGLKYVDRPYRQFQGSLGGSFTVVHMPSYDDTTFHTKLDENGYPLESRRFTFVSLGTKDGFGSNIAYVKPKMNGSRSGHTAGLYGPNGPTNNGLMSHSGDFYTIHRLEKCGIMIKDVTLTGELIPSELRGY